MAWRSIMRSCPLAAAALGLALSLVAHGGTSLAGETIASVRDRFSSPASADVVPDFQRHVVPLLSRLGCNGRACHGSFQGRGGLTLSLFGYDFAADHAALTDIGNSAAGRRVDSASATESLILRKPSEQVEHEGGRRFEVDSWQYRLLQRWIESGAENVVERHTLERLRVFPEELSWRSGDLADGQASPIRLRVEAVWSDGTTEDVSDLARFRTNNDAVVAVDRAGQVRAIGHGDTHVVVFYDNGIQSIPAIVQAKPRDDLVWPDDPQPTAIDRWVNARLRKLGIVPSAICTDAEFLRRASIDLTGTLPTPQETLAFLADESKHKRSKKIDELLARPAFSAWWATKLCDFTGCNPRQQAELGQESAEQWYMWIYQRLLENRPYDEIVEGILVATSRPAGQSYADFAREMSAYLNESTGKSFSARATMPHYWSRESVREPQQKALAVAHSFLGVRLQCAQCHKHPWDQWTQRDFEQFSEFFVDVRFGVPQANREEYDRIARAVGLNPKRKEGVRLTDAQVAVAREGRSLPWREVFVAESPRSRSLELLRSGAVTIEGGADPRQALMQWLREPDNPWFSRAMVNRVWASCFHAGIVDPSDDLNPANPASNPELLNWLAEEFVRQEFDLRWLLGEVTRSATWQRSCVANASNRDDRRHFSRAIPRRLPAEVLYDGIKQAVCGSEEHETVRRDLTRRAVGHLSMRMSGTYAMHVFGKPTRSLACDCDRVNEPSLLQAVFMHNDPLLHLLLGESGWLGELRQVTDPSEAELQAWVDEAWLRALSRPVTRAERDRALRHLNQAKSPAEGMEDLLWSLVNTKEFLLNH